MGVWHVQPSVLLVSPVSLLCTMVAGGGAGGPGTPGVSVTETSQTNRYPAEEL